MTTLYARELDHRALNEAIRGAGDSVRITGCAGQRFIGAGMSGGSIEIVGIPGNALGAYLNGADITVNGNAQDAAGYAMRGGEIYVRDNAGYRAGIHMKEYRDKVPVIVIGGCAGSFLGEYQAGGMIVVLGLGADGREIVGDFPCTGMHGGRMFLRGDCRGIVFPPQVTAREASEQDLEAIRGPVGEFAALFGMNAVELLASPYTVVTPDSANPYRRMYVEN